MRCVATRRYHGGMFTNPNNDASRRNASQRKALRHIVNRPLVLCTYAEKVRSTRIVHPESFRSNVQIPIMFARRNRPRVDCSDEFACVYLHLRAFAFACVCEYCSRSTACAYVRAYIRTCVMSTPFKEHQIKLRAHA